MAEITSIEPQKKDANRCNIYVDGRFYCGIKLEVAVKYRLKTGMQIDVAKLDEIQLETEKSQALDKAMTHISAFNRLSIRAALYQIGFQRTFAFSRYAVNVSAAVSRIVYKRIGYDTAKEALERLGGADEDY